MQLTGGGGHTALLTAEGKLVICGWNKNGQLGTPPSEDITVPRVLPGELPKLTRVSCGWNHTLAISAAGSLVTWGSNSFGQVGVAGGDRGNSGPVVIPREKFVGEKVVDIGAGLRHSLAVTGRCSVGLYTCMNCSYIVPTTPTAHTYIYIMCTSVFQKEFSISFLSPI